jgi:hypothetical protein
MSDERPEYLAYLLRMWRVDKEGDAQWRASLERPSNGECVAFTSLEAVFDFLRERAGQTQAAERTDEPGAADRSR